MRLTESKINPLKELLQSFVDSNDEWIILSSNNLPIMALYFNSGGVVFESMGEVVKGLEILSDMGLVELKDNKLRITKYGKDALEASKGSVRSLQNVEENGSQSQTQIDEAA